MTSIEAKPASPVDLLRGLAAQRYGEQKARELSDQIELLGANIAAVRAYPLTPEVEPWTGAPEVGPAGEAASV